MEAEKMEAHALSLLRKVSSHRAHLSGELRVNATEGLGTLWLMPRLESFQVRHPNLAINLMTTNSHVLDVVDDCDIAIYWQRPIRNGIVSRVLGSVGFSLFAAPEYLARYGTPACFEELANHKVLHFNGYELNPGLDRWVRLMREIKPSMRIESSAASAPLIVGGRYITLYPNYVRLLGHSFVQVPFQTDISLEVWLAFHEDRRRDPRVRALASEIGELAKADRGTWFS
jgi:DNA-binding transcriptional LysR family regulator